jgi:hypothetical protein
MLPYSSLKNGVSGEDVNLPSVRLSNLSQPQDDAAGPPEARVADDVQ